MAITGSSKMIKLCSRGKTVPGVIGQLVVDNIAQGALDLSGSAATQLLLCAPYDIRIKWIVFVYEEASSADAGVDIEVGHQALTGYEAGRTTDRNGIVTYTSEVSKAQYFGAKVTTMDGALGDKLQKGELLTVYNTGGKTGTGTLLVFVGYERHTAE
jgi:hypothetical protein